MRIGLKKPVMALAVTAIVMGAVVPSASALEVGPLTVEITVNPTDWSVCGHVGDDLTGANYTVSLTATGFASDVSRNGVILDQASATGNPADLCLPGTGFDSDYAAVVYTLEWTSVLGTTGVLVKACAEADLRKAIAINPDIVIAEPVRDMIDALLALKMPACTVS